jgi:hypothetical protein
MDAQQINPQNRKYARLRWLWLVFGIFGIADVLVQVVGMCRGNVSHLVTLQSSIHFLASLAMAIGGSWFWWVTRQPQDRTDVAVDVKENR